MRRIWNWAERRLDKLYMAPGAKGGSGWLTVHERSAKYTVSGAVFSNNKHRDFEETCVAVATHVASHEHNNVVRSPLHKKVHTHTHRHTHARNVM